MADVFISYKSERRRAAEHLAVVLEHYGYSVWFDYRLIKGRDFGLQIDRKVREAKALVVLWCTKSVGSRWVAEEADLGHELGILVPVKIESCILPIGFRRLDYVDLSRWDGAPRSASLDPLIKALAQNIGRPPTADLNALWEYEATWLRFGAPALRAFAFDQPSAADEGDRGLPGRRGLNVESSAFATLRAHNYAEEARKLLATIDVANRFRNAEEPEWRETIDAADRRRHSPGERFRDFDGAPEMIVVPAGEFLMGSRDGEGRDDEHPQHKVMIKRPFAVRITPVTRAEFAAFVGATNHKIEPGAFVWDGQQCKYDPTKSWRDPGFKQADDHPVVCVNWYDAQAYAAWLKERSGGKAYRLLSEAEWEYCCRAGTTSAYSTGEEITPEQANFGLNSEGTTPVSRFPTNPWGLHDMHGNVLEMVRGQLAS
jgi:formylglycine-generating enzyme required for sulfatase activity